MRSRALLVCLLVGCASSGPSPLTVDEQLRLATWAQACGPSAGGGFTPGDAAVLMMRGEGEAAIDPDGRLASHRCALAATTCDAFLDCYHVSIAREVTDCVSRCDGDAAITCAAFSTLRTDCAALGGVCVTDTSGVAQCAIGTCTTSLDECEGTDVHHACEGGVETRVFCGPGSSCARNSDGSSSCGARFCANDGGWDCAAIGAVCTPRDCQYADGEACDGTYAASCEGDVSVYCMLGRVRRTDCRALGLDRCQAGLCIPSAAMLR